MSEPVLVVEGLRVDLNAGGAIVEGLDLAVDGGQVLGVVGESGSGKTTLALALLGYARPGSRISAGSIRISGQEVIGRSGEEIRRIRSQTISYVPQDPASALNPALRIGVQIREILRAHNRPGRHEDAIRSVLERVSLPADKAFMRRFPHQLSGGQQQRVALACALVCEPPVVVLDEPTTGLDVITQAHILAEIRRLRDEAGVTMIYISHDVAAVATVADRIAVMYSGRIVEQAPTEALVTTPRHPYTSRLVSSVPDHREPRRLIGIAGVPPAVDERPTGCTFHPRCAQAVARCAVSEPVLEQIAADRTVRCFEWAGTPALVFEPRLQAVAQPAGRELLEADRLVATYRDRSGDVVAANQVSFSIEDGECLALVGESGSGKTTIARCVAGLHKPASGALRFRGEQLPPLAKNRSRDVRRQIQIIFQNPVESLNPYRPVAESVEWPARTLQGMSSKESQIEARRLFELVQLPTRTSDCYPRELSGGECQRVAIARALAAGPQLLVCDEITSALDVSVQAVVLELLGALRAELGLAVLFITHDLGVVASIADRAIVLERGVIVEAGSVESILRTPGEGYTRRLVDAAPSLERVALVSSR